jgi:hypothetical protein
MTELERKAVHDIAGAFSRLSVAAELVTIVLPPATLSAAVAAPLQALDSERKTAIEAFDAAMSALRKLCTAAEVAR